MIVRAEQPLECGTETALGFEAAGKLRVEHVALRAYLRQCHAHPPCTLVGVKRHAGVAAELAARGRRIDAALRLGIGRNTITRKIQELGLE